MDFSIETLKQETAAVMEELFRNCSEGHYTLRKGDILVIGCSTSKVMGFHMGTHSTEDAARAIMETVLTMFTARAFFSRVNAASISTEQLLLNANAWKSMILNRFR